MTKIYQRQSQSQSQSLKPKSQMNHYDLSDAHRPNQYSVKATSLEYTTWAQELLGGDLWKDDRATD